MWFCSTNFEILLNDIYTADFYTFTENLKMQNCMEYMRSKNITLLYLLYTVIKYRKYSAFYKIIFSRDSLNCSLKNMNDTC